MMFSNLSVLVYLCIFSIAAARKFDLTVSYDPVDYDWFHFDFGPDDFMCAKFDVLCSTFLDEIGCAPTNRTILGCNPTLADWSGHCKCLGDPIYIDKGSKISKSIFDNRIKPEIGWMMEPWATGPPYDFDASYPAICELALTRIGCNTSDMTISVGSKDGRIKNKCACGKYTEGGARVEDLICDKMTEAETMQMPIFEDPVTLSVQLSLAITMIIGKLGSCLASFFYLPPIIGFLLSGMGIMDFISQSLIKGCGGNGPKVTPFAEFRNFALVIVLMRAGISLKPKDMLQSKDVLIMLLCFIPYLCEFAVSLGVGINILGWEATDAGLMASILAALSPSLVIPGMIHLVEANVGYVPKIILSAAPFEVVFSIILFNVFSSMEQTTSDPMYPWVHVLPLWANIALIPVNIIFSSILGAFVGYFVTRYIHFRKSIKQNESMGPHINRVLPDSTAEYLFICIVSSYLLFAICTKQYIQQTCGILAVFVMMLTVSELGDEEVNHGLKHGLAGVWVFAEVLLFTTTGINFSYRSTTGPLQSNRGINSTSLGQMVTLLLLGSLGRLGGIVALLTSLYSFLQPQFRNARAIFLLAISIYTFQLPKATIQATLGGLPAAMKIIPGQRGYTRGIFIQQASVLAILIFATVGVFLTKLVGEPAAKELRDIAPISVQKAEYISPEDYAEPVDDSQNECENKKCEVEMTAE